MYGKNRGDSGEIGTRRTFWLYCWRQELFLSKDNIRHYHPENRCDVKALQIQKGQEHDVVTSSHPSKSTLWFSIDMLGQVMCTSPSSEILSGRIVWLLSEAGSGVIALSQGNNDLSSRRASERRKALATLGRIIKSFGFLKLGVFK